MSVILPPINPIFGLTTQEMINLVKAELRNTSIDSLIVAWLNQAILDLSAHYIFHHLKRYNSAVTTPSIPDVLLQQDMLWLRTISIPDEQRRLTPYPGDEESLADVYPDYRERTGSVDWYYLSGPHSIGLWMVPVDAKTISYAYQKRPLKLDIVQPNVYSDLPAEWHPMVVQRALTRGYMEEGNGEGADRSTAMENRLLARLAMNVYRRPDQTIVAGASNQYSTGTKPGAPKLPSTYPKV